MMGVIRHTWQRVARLDIVKHGASLVSGAAVGQLAMLLAMPLLSRLFTKTEFGEFTLYTSVAGFLAVVVALRYDVAIVLPKDDKDAKILALMAAALATVLSMVAAGVLALAAPLVVAQTGSEAFRYLLPLGAAGGLLLALFTTFSYWMNRRLRYGQIAGGRIIMMSGTAVSQVGMGLLGTPSAGLAAGALMGQASGVLYFVVRLRKGLAAFLADVRSAPREVFRRGWALLGEYRRMPLLNGPTAMLDVLRLGAVNFAIGLASVSALGLFGMAWKLLEVPSFLLGNAIAQLVLQRLANAEPGPRYRFMVRATLACIGLGAIPYGLIYLLAPWIVPWLLGAQYAESAAYAQVLVPWVYIGFVAGAMAPFFVVTNRQHVPLIISIAYLVVAIVILLVFSSDIFFAIIIVSLTSALLLGVQVLWGVLAARRDLVDQRRIEA